MISIRADCRTLSYKNRALRSGSIGKMQSRVNERRLRILGGSTLFGRRFVKLSRGVSISAKFGQNSVFESPIASLDLFFPLCTAYTSPGGLMLHRFARYVSLIPNRSNGVPHSGFILYSPFSFLSSILVVVTFHAFFSFPEIIKRFSV